MDNTLYFNPDGYTPLFQIILAFTIGVIFSPYSSGIYYLIIIILIFEIIYAYQCNCNYTNEKSFLRGALILTAILGWLFGRVSICKDWNPIRGDYSEIDYILKKIEDNNKYQEEMKMSEDWD